VRRKPNDSECSQVVIDAAKRYLNHHPPDFKLFRGSRGYTANQIIESLEKEEEFRAWFVENVLKLSTELFLRGSP